MNAIRNAVLAALGIAMVFAFGCRRQSVQQGPGPGHGYGREDTRVFEVYIYTDPTDPSKCWLDWSVGTLWKPHQTVTWFSDDGRQYTVNFNGTNGSPFQSSTFPVAAGGFTNSGALQPNASGYYEFAVLNAQNSQCKDPKDPGYYVK